MKTTFALLSTVFMLSISTSAAFAQSSPDASKNVSSDPTVQADKEKLVQDNQKIKEAKMAKHADRKQLRADRRKAREAKKSLAK